MKDFVFEKSQKNVLLGAILIGFACLIATYFIDPVKEGHHLRFWTNLLHNSTFFTGIAFTVTFVLAATTIAYAGWHVAFKRIWEAMSMFLPVGLILIFIVGLSGQLGLHHLYHWMDDAVVASDKILKGKSGFLNFPFYLVSIVFGFVWFFFARKFRQISLAQDEDRNTDDSYPWYAKLKVYSAIFLPIAGFSSAAAIWLWMMSIDPHWYSTMYAWYTTASWWVSAVSITILLIIYLKSKGYAEHITVEHMHDLGKFLFAFSVFWTYLWFSQYMLIWYANIGEETIYYRQRMGQFPVLFYGNLVMNFVLPFLILIRNDTKRKFGTMAFVAGLVLFGHWWDFFQMIKIGPYVEAIEHHAKAGHSSSEHSQGTHSDNSANGHTENGASKNAQNHTDSHGKEGHLAGTPVEGSDSSHLAGNSAHDGTQNSTTVANTEGGDHSLHSIEVVKASSAIEELETVNKAEYFYYQSDMTAGYGIPGLLELGIFIGFLALFIFVVLSSLEKASLLPKNDPYLEETLHHHS